MIDLLSKTVKNLLHGWQGHKDTEEQESHVEQMAQDESKKEEPRPAPQQAKAEEPPKKLPVLTRKCIEAAAKMKGLFEVLEKERNVFAKSYIDLKLAAYQIKDLAKRGGFPMGVDLANELHDYMDSLKALDDKAVLILKFHLEALTAVFLENRKSNNDQTAQEVINSLHKVR